MTVMAARRRDAAERAAKPRRSGGGRGGTRDWRRRGLGCDYEVQYEGECVKVPAPAEAVSTRPCFGRCRGETEASDGCRGSRFSSGVTFWQINSVRYA